MKPKFKAGDKVTVYGYDSNGETNERAIHIVKGIYNDWVKVKFVGDTVETPTFVHKFQCRRLVKKTKRSLAV